MSIKVNQFKTKQAPSEPTEGTSRAKMMLAERKQSRRIRSSRTPSSRTPPSRTPSSSARSSRAQFSRKLKKAVVSRRQASRRLAAGLRRELAGEQGRQAKRKLAELTSMDGFARRLEAAQRELEVADWKHASSAAVVRLERQARVEHEADLQKRLLEARDAVKLAYGRREVSLVFGAGSWPQTSMAKLHLGKRVRANLLDYRQLLTSPQPGIELDAEALAASLDAPLEALDAAFDAYSNDSDHPFQGKATSSLSESILGSSSGQ